MGRVEGPASDCTTFPGAARLVILATSRSSPECELELERERSSESLLLWRDGAREDLDEVVSERSERRSSSSSVMRVISWISMNGGAGPLVLSWGRLPRVGRRAGGREASGEGARDEEGLLDDAEDPVD